MKLVGITLAAIVGYAAAAAGDAIGDCKGKSKSDCQKDDACKYNREAEDKIDWFCESKKDEKPTKPTKPAKKSCADEGYACSGKSDKCCKLAMKDKEAGRKDADKCYLDKSKSTKDARCVDHTVCEQVTKKGWCKKFYGKEPWGCAWSKASGKCETPYVEPETCEGKSAADCKEHEDACVSKDDGSCETWDGECPSLDTMPECLPKGCIWFNGPPGAIPECVEECPEGWTGDKCDEKAEEACPDLISSDAKYDFTVTALRKVGDLGIVMDVSGSMATEIAGVKAGIIAAADGALGGEDPPYARGAVMEYSDPSTRFLGIGNAAQFKANVARITRGMGKSEWGGDCPEVMYRGINACMGVINDWSTIYAITDASAKDASMAAGVTNTAKARHIRINFILTATCVKWYESPPFTGIHSVYKTTAAGTGGQIYQITKSSSLGPKVTAVIKAAADDALATTDVAYWEFSGGSNPVTVNGYNHQTNFHVSVVGASASLSCTNENTGGPVAGHKVIVNIDTVKTWSIPRVNSAGVHLWHSKLVCATGAAKSYTVTVRSGYSRCKKNWCKNGGECKHIKACKLFTCKCPAGKIGTYCEV